MKDSDVLAQYKQMRETLVYLSHLDHDDTQNQVRPPAIELRNTNKQYKQMHETLVYLSHLDHDDTQNQVRPDIATALSLNLN
eukprot:1187539-Prorocentrum_minimum.AAC.1